MIMYAPQLCGPSARYTPVALRQVYSRLTQRFYREMLPKALASRSILLSRLHCGEKSLLLVKLAPLGISIRAPTRSVLDGRQSRLQHGDRYRHLVRKSSTEDKRVQELRICHQGGFFSLLVRPLEV